LNRTGIRLGIHIDAAPRISVGQIRQTRILLTKVRYQLVGLRPTTVNCILHSRTRLGRKNNRHQVVRINPSRTPLVAKLIQVAVDRVAMIHHDLDDL
jgi:hypothetical protein